jgi:hypothetical protein
VYEREESYGQFGIALSLYSPLDSLDSLSDPPVSDSVTKIDSI